MILHPPPPPFWLVQLDDIPSLDFRVRGPYIQAFIKRLRLLTATKNEEEDGGEQ